MNRFEIARTIQEEFGVLCQANVNGYTWASNEDVPKDVWDGKIGQRIKELEKQLVNNNSYDKYKDREFIVQDVFPGGVFHKGPVSVIPREVPYVCSLLMASQHNKVTSYPIDYKKHELILTIWMIESDHYTLQVGIKYVTEKFWFRLGLDMLILRLNEFGADPDNENFWFHDDRQTERDI